MAAPSERELPQPVDEGDGDGGQDEGEMDHRLPGRLSVWGARMAGVTHLDERPQHVERRDLDDENAPISMSRLPHPSRIDPIPGDPAPWAEAGAAEVAISATAARAASATGARLGRRVARMLMGLYLLGRLTA